MAIISSSRKRRYRLSYAERPSRKKILHYFGNPEYTIVLPEERQSHPQSFPAYLVPPISISEYMTHTDPTLYEASLQAVIIDLGSGQ